MADKDKVARYLRHIGYYRLSPYVRHFEVERDVLTAGTTFEDVLSRYVFDRRLRLVVLDAMERVEVAVRAAIGDHMAVRGGPHWYEDRTLLKSDGHQRIVEDVDELVRRQLARRPERKQEDSLVPALEHYITTYGSPVRPPSWVVLEELSLGSLRNLYLSIEPYSHRTVIAKSLGVNEPLLASWLQSYQRVRNISAHHGRLWNRGLGVTPKIPQSRSVRWLDDAKLFERDGWRRQRLYPVLASLQTVLHTISPGSTWGYRLRDLLAQYPDIPLGPMGIPELWFEDSFWLPAHDRRMP